MQNGLYKLEFGAPGRGIGSGVVIYRDGEIAGGDAGFAWTGTIVDDEGALSGDIHVFEHSPGHENVFPGLTDFHLTVTGQVLDNINVGLYGKTPSAPGVSLQIAMQLLVPR